MPWTNIFFKRKRAATKVSLQQESIERHASHRSSGSGGGSSDTLSPRSPSALGELGAETHRPRAEDIPQISNGQPQLSNGPMPSGRSRKLSDGFDDDDLPPLRISPAPSKSGRSTSQDSTPTATPRETRRSEEMLRPDGTVSPIDLESVLLRVQQTSSGSSHRGSRSAASTAAAALRAALPPPRDVPEDARPPFGDAIEEADVAALAALLDEHPDAARICPWGDDAGSLLHKAAEEGGAGVVELLLERGCADVAVVDDDGQTALHVAVANGHLVCRLGELKPLVTHSTSRFAPVSAARSTHPFTRVCVRRTGCREQDATRALVASPDAWGLLTLLDKFKMSPFHLACEGGEQRRSDATSPLLLPDTSTSTSPRPVPRLDPSPLLPASPYLHPPYYASPRQAIRSSSSSS